MCNLENNRHRGKRAAVASAVAIAGAVGPLAETGSNIVFSALDYFDKKEKQHQDFLKERPDAVDLGNAGVQIDLTNDKGFLDVGGEFQMGGTHLKVQNVERKAPEQKSGGEAFTYPAGIGPMLMN